MNVIRTLIGFTAFMLLFIGGADVGGVFGGIAGFILGVGVWAATTMGKFRFTRDLVVKPKLD